jgi:hypothetical protein
MEVIFHGPLIVTNLNYDEYIEAHHEEVERIRAKVESAAAGAANRKSEDMEKN